MDLLEQIGGNAVGEPDPREKPMSWVVWFREIVPGCSLRTAKQACERRKNEWNQMDRLTL